MCINFCAYYLRPDDNSTGSLGVHPEDEAPVEQWRERHGITTEWAHAVEPTSGERLKALRPIEGRALAELEALGLDDGQLCRVELRAVALGGRMAMHLESVRPAVDG